MVQGTRTHSPKYLISQFRKHLAAAFTILLLAVLLRAGLALLTINALEAASQEQMALKQESNDLLTAMVNQETGVRGYVATADPVFLEPFLQGQRAYQLAFVQTQALLRTASFPAGQQQLLLVDQRARAWQDQFAGPQLRLVAAHQLRLSHSPHVAIQGKALFDRF